eukprot:CAMPEP_0185852502 /NCGR_PEP_ID=MMETSP1354-20130828/14971_1 /TAXON_ID=708628 /ORGANISM="Erythrolobus madagascarensis, Strain CCMP3276" /LENGTH=39 /DNA_ID= /DNA_START= /DNA_END= /DNA_ORIENTATION=
MNSDVERSDCPIPAKPVVVPKPTKKAVSLRLAEVSQRTL